MKAINTAEAFNYMMDLMVTFGDTALVQQMRNQNINSVDPSGFLTVTPVNFVLEAADPFGAKAQLLAFYAAVPEMENRIKDATKIVFFGTTITGNYNSTIKTAYKNDNGDDFVTKYNESFGVAPYAQDDTIMTHLSDFTVNGTQITFNGWLLLFKPNTP